MGFGRKKNRSDSPDDYDEEDTYPCRNCDRNFTKTALKRHEPICKKVATKSRKPFDSGKQRATDSDVPISAIRNRQKEYIKQGGKYSAPSTNWKDKSRDVRDGAKAGRDMKRELTKRNMSASPRRSKSKSKDRGGGRGRSNSKDRKGKDDKKSKSRSKSKDKGSKSRGSSKRR